MPSDAPVAHTPDELQSYLDTYGAERAFRLIATTNATGEFDSGITFNLEGGGPLWGVRFSSAEIAAQEVVELLGKMSSLHCEGVVTMFGLRALTFHSATVCPDMVHRRR